MAVCIQVSAKRSSPRLQSEGRIGLAEAIEDFLGETGLVGCGGSGSMGWDIEITDVEEDDLEDWLERLAGFLREWGAPLDTLLCVYSPYDENFERASVSKYDGRVVPVFPETP